MVKSIHQNDLALELKKWTDGPKYVLITSMCPSHGWSYDYQKLVNVAYSGNVHEVVVMGNQYDLYKWVIDFKGHIGTIYGTFDDVGLVVLAKDRPDLDIIQISCER